MTSCPGRNRHRSSSAVVARRASARVRAVAGSAAARTAARSRAARAARSGFRSCSVSHLAVFSHPMPRLPASTPAAAADGARPTTDPGPCSACHAADRAARVRVLPDPAGPTSTSRSRPDPATRCTAAAWSSNSPATAAAGDGGGRAGAVAAGVQQPRLGVQQVAGGVPGAVRGPERAAAVRPAQRIRDRGRLRRGEQHRAGRDLGDHPRGRLVAGGSGREPVRAQRPGRLGLGVPGRPRGTLARQRRHDRGRRVVHDPVQRERRFRRGEPGSGRSRCRCASSTTRPAHARASVPRMCSARRRQASVRSASGWTSFGPRVASVACCRSRSTTAGPGRRPCAAT